MGVHVGFSNKAQSSINESLSWRLLEIYLVKLNVTIVKN